MKEIDKFKDKVAAVKSERRSFMKKLAITLSAAPLLLDTKSQAADITSLTSNSPAMPSEVSSNPTLKILSEHDGLKFVGTCSDVQNLSKTIPEFPGQIIFVSSWSENHSQNGCGFFTAVKDSTLDTNGGTQFKAPGGWCWVRVIEGDTIDATWFGVSADGTDCGDNIAKAISYITHNGGVLSFPAGEINFGKYRVSVNWFKGIKPFTIKGQGASTIFTFDNIDPPERPENKNWVMEPNLFHFRGNTDDCFIDSVTIQDLCINYTRQRNRGGTNLDQLSECHPTPHSKGVTALFFDRCLNPKVSNVRLTDIYGSGIYVRRCFNPLMERVHMYDVSSNQILARDKRMDRDEFGGGIFYWACYGGKMNDCVAWNTRKYTVDILSPDNKQQIKKTLCGYIGFWTEFGSKEGIHAAPMIDWLNITGGQLDRVSRGVEISNCIAYGYVIGIKAEAKVDVSIINNIVLNCYLPINCSGVRGVVQRNFTDMLQAEDVKCPQGGYEERRSHLGGVTFTKYGPSNLTLEISHNYVHTKNYAAVNVSRTNLKFLYNYIEINGVADMFKSSGKGRLFGLEISGNTFYYSRLSAPKPSTIAYNITGIIERNSFIINSKSPAVIIIRNNEQSPNIQFRDNVITGPLDIKSASSINIRNNVFSNRTLNPSRIELNADHCSICGNIFELPSTMINEPIVLRGSNHRIENNNFHLIPFSEYPVKIAAYFRLARGTKNLIFRSNHLLDEKNNISLVVASEVSSLLFFDNTNSGDGVMLYTEGKIYGPVVNERNQFKAGLLSGKFKEDPNRVSNLDDDFKPMIGERLYYQLPAINGAEGIVLTSKGWREFGHISNDEPI